MNPSASVSLVDSIGYSILGMSIVFAVLIMLMVVVKVIEKLVNRSQASEPAAPAPAAAAPAVPAKPAEPAPGTAGELKLYNVSERDAAMVMAIVADSLGKPLNELRFISIREVTEE